MEIIGTYSYLKLLYVFSQIKHMHIRISDGEGEAMPAEKASLLAIF